MCLSLIFFVLWDLERYIIWTPLWNEPLAIDHDFGQVHVKEKSEKCKENWNQTSRTHVMLHIEPLCAIFHALFEENWWSLVNKPFAPCFWTAGVQLRTCWVSTHDYTQAGQRNALTRSDARFLCAGSRFVAPHSRDNSLALRTTKNNNISTEFSNRRQYLKNRPYTYNFQTPLTPDRSNTSSPSCIFCSKNLCVDFEKKAKNLFF